MTLETNNANRCKNLKIISVLTDLQLYKHTGKIVVVSRKPKL